MKNIFLTLTITILVACLPTVIGAWTYSLTVAALGNGQIRVVAGYIPGGGVGRCAFDVSTNLITWTPVVTNTVQNGWCTNTFQITNGVVFYRARVY